MEIVSAERRTNGTESSEHFTSYRHPYYRSMAQKWTTTWQHYVADLKQLRTKEFLFRRAQGESIEQFDERMQNADYLPLFGLTVDTMVGRISNVEKQDFRSFDESGVGAIEQGEDSVAGRLWYNIDGAGCNYLTLVTDAAVVLTALHECWILVDGLEREGETVVGDATARVIMPGSVVNWREDKRGNPLEVVVQHYHDTRESIKDKPKREERYTVYKLDGYETYRVVQTRSGKREVLLLDEMPYGNGFAYYRSRNKTDANRTLPIFRVKLPLRRFVGYIWSEKNNVIFNRESERDNILRVANTPKLQVVAPEDQWDKILDVLEKGGNTIFSDPESPRDHSYISPQTGSADISSSVFDRKVAAFMLSAFQSYEDSARGRARQRTATEVRHDASMGEGSFLSTLATALDELENAIWWRLEQIYFPDETDKWGGFSCERPREFTPLDEGDEAAALQSLFFAPDGVPVGSTGRANAASKIARLKQIEVDEDEIAADVESRDRENALFNRPPTIE